MDKEDFYAAQIVENEGWEFCRSDKDGWIIFTRMIGGVLFTAKIGKDS